MSFEKSWAKVGEGALRMASLRILESYSRAEEDEEEEEANTSCSLVLIVLVLIAVVAIPLGCQS